MGGGNNAEALPPLPVRCYQKKKINFSMVILKKKKSYAFKNIHALKTDQN